MLKYDVTSANVFISKNLTQKQFRENGPAKLDCPSSLDLIEMWLTDQKTNGFQRQFYSNNIINSKTDLKELLISGEIMQEIESNIIYIYISS